MKSIFLLLAIAGLAACGENSSADNNKESAADNSVSDSAAAAVPVSDKRCYTYFSAQDTITLVLNGPDSALHGSLVYALSGKDRNLGTINGKMLGDTLFANYQFRSEGVLSEREVSFIKQGDQLIEGYGPVAEKEGKMVFTDHKGIKYTSNFALKAENCR